MDSAEEDVIRFRRYLVIGSSHLYQIGTSRVEDAGSPDLLQRLLINGRGMDMVKEVVSCQDIPNIKASPSLYALAVCSRSSCTETKQSALNAIGTICKTPAQLFSFINYSKSLTDTKKGWGRALRRSVSKWYNSKDPHELAVLTTRYKSSAGWTHVDVLRLSHAKPETPGIGVVMKYLLKGLSSAMESSSEEFQPLLQYLEAVDTVKHSADEIQVAALIRQHELYKEHIPTKLLNSSEVWCALIERMTACEMIANIGKIASLNILDESSPAMPSVIKKLQDENALINHRVLPMNVLIALRTYEQGKGKWSKNNQVIAALNETYSLVASKCSTNIGKRILVGVKVSSDPSKNSVRGTMVLSPMAAAAGLIHGLLQTGSDCRLVSFLSDVRPLAVTRNMPLPDICKELAKAAVPLPPQLCQCDLSSPIRWAEENGQYDVIIIMSDSKESAKDVKSAIDSYRKTLRIQTRFVLCGLTGSQLDESDSCDIATLQITGFDSSVPVVISKFACGHI